MMTSEDWHGSSAPLRFHRHHEEIAAEAFARPATPISAPASVTRLSIAFDAGEAQHDLAADHLAEMCRSVGAAPPPRRARHFVLETPDWTLIWERHTEFVSFTIVAPGDPDLGWSRSALDAIDLDWLTRFPGEVVSATHLALRPADSLDTAMDVARAAFGHDDFTGMTSSHMPVAVAADFRPDPKGFVRMIVFCCENRASYNGRLVQRLLEIDFYRLAALLSLPVARALSRDVRRLEDDLTTLLKSMSGRRSHSQDAANLDRLSEIAARIEQLEHDTRYRFDAGAAYYQIVRERIERLRETRIEGRQRLSTFMEHRLAPAMRSCAASQGRLQSLAERVGRAISLLSTRVSVSIERQNADQLETLNQRSGAQLRLQQTVEGLSTVAISYYGVGLVQYALKALKGAGGPDVVEIGTGVAIPVMLLAVFSTVRHIRKRIARA